MWFLESLFQEDTYSDPNGDFSGSICAKFQVGLSGCYPPVWNFLFNCLKAQIIQVLLPK